MTPPSNNERPGYKGPGNKIADNALQIVALYDGFAAGIRVREAYAWLSQVIESGIQMKGIAWNFDTLAREDFRPASLREAANANLLIVAARGDQRLPVQVVSWLERCLSRSLKLPFALVGLGETAEGDEATECLLYQDIAKVAARWGVEFIPGSAFESRLDASMLRHMVDQEESALDNPYADRFAWRLSEAPMAEFYQS